MRQGVSRQKAAARAKTTVRTIQKYSRPAIRRREGLYEALPADQMPRLMPVLTGQGVTVVEVRGSRLAARLSQYWHAVDHYLRTGDRRLLRGFEGKHFRASSHLFAFLTDPELLVRLGEVGEVRFEDLYETTA